MFDHYSNKDSSSPENSRVIDSNYSEEMDIYKQTQIGHCKVET